MIGNKSILGLIVARAGSKGIPGKNLKMLHGKPLLAWTIEVAKASKYIDRLIISTDGVEIANCAKALGCEVPFMRDTKLAGDRSPVMDTVIDALDREGRGVDIVCLLQPTSPLRLTADIDEAIEKSQKALGCISVTPAKNHPFWTYFINGERLIGPPAPTNRQELIAAYTPNGCAYVSEVHWLRTQRSFLTEETIAHIMPPERSVDIDDAADWHMAEYYFSRRCDWDG